MEKKESLLTDKYDLCSEICHGKFSRILVAYDKELQQKVAVKLFLRDDYNDILFIASEIALQEILFHPYITSSLGFHLAKTGSFMAIQLGFCNLQDYRRLVPIIPEADVKKITIQISSALHYLHIFNVHHGDIRAENIILFDLYDGYFNIKLGDFGISGIELNVDNSFATDLNARINYKTDYKSLGTLMFLMLYNKIPVVSTRKSCAIAKKRGPPKFIVPDYPKISATTKSFLFNLLKASFTKEKFASHPFLRNKLVPGIVFGDFFDEVSESAVAGLDALWSQKYGMAILHFTKALHLAKMGHESFTEKDKQFLFRERINEYLRILRALRNSFKEDKPFPMSQFCEWELMRYFVDTHDLTVTIDEAYIAYVKWRRGDRSGAAALNKGIDELAKLVVMHPNQKHRDVYIFMKDEWYYMLNDEEYLTDSDEFDDTW